MTSDNWVNFDCDSALHENITVNAVNPYIAFDLKRFSDCYLLGNEVEDNPIPESMRACAEIEQEIESIKNKSDDWDRIDVLKILAWKTGNINHIASRYEFQNTGRLDFVYKNNHWSEENLTAKIGRYSFDSERFVELADRIINIRRNYREREDIPEVWDGLMEIYEGFNGIGPVYMITLMYFITMGAKPIFDRFALAAIVAIQLRDNNRVISCGSEISCVLPGRDRIDRVRNLINEDSVYGWYCAQLADIFPNERWRDREVDRALWVYGHYFKPRYR